MKWLFVLLLLVNAAFWMWTQWYKPAVDRELYQPRPAVNAQQLRVLSEPGAPVPPRAPAEAAAPASTSTVCYRMGPFAAQAKARAAGQRLQARAPAAFTYTLSEERHDSPTVYRIVLPGFASQKAAQAKIKEIDRLGIKDYAVIATPDKRPAISLGVFSQKAGAERYLQELANKGIKAQLEPVTRVQPGFWLDLAPMLQTAVRQLQALTADQDGAQWRERPCTLTPALTRP